MEKQEKKPFYKRWWFITIAVIFVLTIITAASDDAQQTVQNVPPDEQSVAETKPSRQVTSSDVNTQPVVQDTPPDIQPVAEVKQPSPVVQKQYVETFTFSGNGQKKSEPFIITGSRFKIAYDCGGDDPDFTFCQAFVYEVGSKLPEGVMNSTEAIKDETVIYGNGEYYIDANIIGNFTMTVYDYR